MLASGLANAVLVQHFVLGMFGTLFFTCLFFLKRFLGQKKGGGGKKTCPECNSVFELFGFIKIISFSSHRLAVEFLPAVVALLKCYPSYFPIRLSLTFLAACDFFGCL